jgi:hypothetical protein
MKLESDESQIMIVNLLIPIKYRQTFILVALLTSSNISDYSNKLRSLLFMERIGTYTFKSIWHGLINNSIFPHNLTQI